MHDVQHLLLERARCRTLEEIFDLVASTLGCLPDVALCRIWLQEQADPALCSLPVVVVSGAGPSQSLPEGILGAVPKPVDLDKVRMTVQRIIGPPEVAMVH